MELVVDDAKTLLHSPLPPPRSHPWLLFCPADTLAIFYSISEHRYYKTRLSFMKDKLDIASTSKDGWMVLRDWNNHDFFLLNVYSLDTVQLPKLELVTNYACLSSTPDDPNCYVVLGDGNVERFTISFCKMGDKEFVTHRLDRYAAIQSVISFGGNLYGLRYHKFALVRVELKGQSVQFQELMSNNLFEGNPRLGSKPYMRGYIGESCGNIILVIKIYLRYSRSYNHVEDFKIFRADLCKKKWVEMKTIGEHTIFLGCFGGMFCIRSDNANVRKNCIYFVEERDQDLYVFNIEDKSITITLPCRSVGNRYAFPRWIL